MTFPFISGSANGYGIAAVETLLLSWLFLAVDVPEMLWTRHVEDELAKKITALAG